MSLRDRVAETSEVRGELTLYRLDRRSEIVCARCVAHQTTRWVAVIGDDWTHLWCKSCFLAAPGTDQDVQ